MSGRELATRILQQRPRLPIVYISGYTDDQLSPQGVTHESTVLVRKPFEAEQLFQAIERAMQLSQTRRAARAG
jgi:FixJ family two-component response regulator